MSDKGPILIKASISVLILIILILFILHNSKIFFIGPQIEVYSPKDGSSFTEPIIEIKGQAKNISFISLDDNPIFVDENGIFKEKLLLNPGVSIIKLYAQDRFERDVEIRLYYIYTGTSTPLINKEIINKVINTSTTTEESTTSDKEE